jgi:transcriptional regulator with XRE-family HTH domain
MGVYENMVMVLVPTKREPPSPAALARGAQLQALRKRVKKTQQDIAEALKRSHKTISAYETGRAELGVDDFNDWARALGVSVAELTSALGLGLPAETGCLHRDLAVLFGPDEGEQVEQLVREMADLNEQDRATIIESFRDQVTGRHVRRQRD